MLKAFPGTWQVATEKKKAMLMQAFCMSTWWITGLWDHARPGQSELLGS